MAYVCTYIHTYVHTVLEIMVSNSDIFQLFGLLSDPKKVWVRGLAEHYIPHIHFIHTQMLPSHWY